MAVVPKSGERKLLFFLCVAAGIIGLIFYFTAWLFSSSSDSVGDGIFATLLALLGLILTIGSALIIAGIAFYKRYGYSQPKDTHTPK